MLLAEDLLLLLYDDESGRAVVDGTRTELGLAGAVLLDLAMQERVAVAGPGEEVRKGRLYVSDDRPAGDPILDDALARIRDKAGRTPKSVLTTIKKKLRDRVLDRLAERGIVQRQDRKVLGLFPVSRWPAADSTRERETRRRLHDVLVVGVEPDDRTAALVALLAAMDAVTKVVPADDRRALKRRAKEVAEGAWAADAVRKAIQDVQTAIMAGIMASAAAGTAASN